MSLFRGDIEKSMKKISVLFILTSIILLAGCQIAPGSHIDTSGKNIVQAQDDGEHTLTHYQQVIITIK